MAEKGPKECCRLHGARVGAKSIPLCTQNHSVYAVAKVHSSLQIQELHDLLAFTEDTQRAPS